MHLIFNDFITKNYPCSLPLQKKLKKLKKHKKIRKKIINRNRIYNKRKTAKTLYLKDF